jgi:hypothetical protein
VKILRELSILILAIAGFASGVAAYLTVFHGGASIKDILSVTAAATIGLYVGRYVEKGLAHG